MSASANICLHRTLPLSPQTFHIPLDTIAVPFQTNHTMSTLSSPIPVRSHIIYTNEYKYAHNGEMLVLGLCPSTGTQATFLLIIARFSNTRKRDATRISAGSLCVVERKLIHFVELRRQIIVGVVSIPDGHPDGHSLRVDGAVV